MGITVNGAGSMGTQPAMKGMLSVKSGSAAKVRMGIVGNKENKVPAKRLNYNHREISGQLVRAKKAQSAATILTRAKSRLAFLQRCAGTGQYDQKEIANALAHARRMVRCAQMKVRNLKEEEQEQKKHGNESESEIQQKKSEIKRRAAQKERELKNKANIEVTQQVLKEKSRRQEILRKRRMHRNEERGKINEADMKYIKGELERQPAGYSQEQGVYLELSASAAALTELQIMQMAEQEAQVEIEQMPDVSDGVNMGSGVSSGVSVSEGAAAESASSVDISI